MVRSASLLLLAMAVLCLAPQAHTQPEKRPVKGDKTDLTELMPDSTLAYIELKHPPLMKEIRELIKGSGLEDYAAFRDEHAPKDRSRFGFGSRSAILAFILTPEFLDELDRFEHAVVLTGFDKYGRPRTAWVIKANGDSSIINLVFRDILTLVPTFRTVAKVEGVRLYRHNWRDEFEEKLKDNGDKKEDPPEPVIALMPQRVILGTDVELVGDIVRRFKGKKDGGSLASSKDFQTAAVGLREKPGVFASARLDKIFGKDGPLVRGGNAPWAFNTFFGAEPIFLNTAMFFNPQTIERGVGYLGIDGGTIELQMRFATPAGGTSPLGALMGDRPASHELLHYAPKHSVAALSAPLAGKAEAWAEAMKQLEPIAKRYNLGDDLSRKNIEAAFVQSKIDPSKDIFARVANVGLAVVPTEKGELGVVFVVEAVDADAGEKLAGIWKAFGEDKPAQLRGLEMGRDGKVLVLASSAKLAEMALTAGAKADGFAARPEVAAMLKGAKGAKIVGGWSVQSMLGVWLASEQQAIAKSKKRGKGEKDETDPEALKQYESWLKKVAADMPKLLEKFPAGKVSVTLGKDHVTLVVRQAGLRGVAPHLIDAFLLSDLLQSR